MTPQTLDIFTASDSIGRGKSTPSATPMNGTAPVPRCELRHRVRTMCAGMRLRSASSALLCLLMALADEDRTCS
jgi:hypothetical protein